MATSGYQSCRDLARKRLLIDMLQSVRPASGKWKVLVVDAYSMRILSAAARMFDIMEDGVSIVEPIHLSRQPFPNMEAVYFLSPTQQSVDTLVQDFKKRKNQYAAVHLFFTSRLPDALFHKITSEEVASKIRGLKELNVDFLAVEPQAFHMDASESFKTLFSPSVSDVELRKEQKSLAAKLTTVCATLGEYPYVRYPKASAGHQATESFAASFQESLNDLKKSVPDFPPRSDRGRGTVLVLDRTVDPVAPLLHEFTYQAMAYDLVEINGTAYKYVYTDGTGREVSKDVLLDENDSLWPQLRHMHIKDSSATIVGLFNEFVRTNKAIKLVNKGGVADIKQMSAAMKSMPDYQETLSKYSLHMDIAGKCMAAFKANQLEKLATVEQDMATGETADGSVPRNLMGTIVRELGDGSIKDSDKIRLLMLYIATTQSGMNESDITTMLDKARMSPSTRQDAQQAIQNMQHIGVAVTKGSRARTQLKHGKKRDDDEEVNVFSRYVPRVKQILEDVTEGCLDATHYPFMGDADPGGAKKAAGPGKSLKNLGGGSGPAWAQKKKGGDAGGKGGGDDEGYGGARLIVYILGGMTYSEMRSAYEISQASQREVIMGSTHVITPQRFIGNLLMLS